MTAAHPLFIFAAVALVLPVCAYEAVFIFYWTR